MAGFLEALSVAPPFGSSAPARCKICGADAPPFDAADFYRVADGTASPSPYVFGFSGVAIPYFRCKSCDFLFANAFDNWSSEEFARYIYNDQYVLADPEYLEARPKRMAGDFAELLRPAANLNILDYGSGTGIFSKELMQKGFGRVDSYDPFAFNNPPSGKFDVITCFEVVEHSPDPLATFRHMLSFLNEGGAIIVSQCLQPDDIARIRCNWWYVAPRNGHISTYSLFTFAKLAEQLGLRVYQGPELFLFAGPRVSKAVSDILRHFSAAGMARQRLLAGNGGDEWHSVEDSDRGRFAWTRKQTVTWASRPVFAGVNEFVVPYVIEIDRNFARNSRILVDGREVETVVNERGLVGKYRSSETGRVDVSLRQPPLVSPATRGVDDQRLLGLGVAEQ
jgi:2-polyprenyl-3-methyl-5-hydroxy-6-metoxy-1,4-benzoquinol methylase